MAWYPDLGFVPWMFEHDVPRGYWKQEENHKAFFDWLGKKSGHKTLDEWYNIERRIYYKYGGMGLLRDYYSDSPATALQRIYPNHRWDSSLFGRRYQFNYA